MSGDLVIKKILVKTKSCEKNVSDESCLFYIFSRTLVLVISHITCGRVPNHTCCSLHPPHAIFKQCIMGILSADVVEECWELMSC